MFLLVGFHGAHTFPRYKSKIAILALIWVGNHRIGKSKLPASLSVYLNI